MKTNRPLTHGFIAHVLRNDSTGCMKIQTVEEHSKGVADLASRNASFFGAEGWGYICGLWHDVGKYSDEFQEYIGVKTGILSDKPGLCRTDHSTAGAQLAKEVFSAGGQYLPISYCIAGHHSGLADYTSANSSSLSYRLSNKERLDGVRMRIPSETLPSLSALNIDISFWHLWIRMLYSSLVDADFLDTERFMNPEVYSRRGKYKTLEELYPLLKAYLKRFESAPDTEVNRVRRSVQDACRKRWADAPGVYTLTVPTGGGKTLSSLLWGMEHALKNGQRRIIIAIPYISIVSQTADTLRKIFGKENVVEHHSSVDPSYSESGFNHLACENWDAPIIVTTNVQLFESLYARKSSRCRKLHNICRSVLILDEVQMLPTQNLKPILDILNSLSSSFGTSILMTTATKPVFSGKIGAGVNVIEGLASHEIMEDLQTLFSTMRRVRVEFEERTLSVDELVEKLAKERQVLCVVNRRQDARDIYEKLRTGTTIHLSRNMCQQHISDKLKEIREKLQSGEEIRVVSTQLIEAGVDIDFPSVYRMKAGMDSIAQAAGRCNREGRMNEGLVTVFELQGSEPRGIFRKGVEALNDAVRSLENRGEECLYPEVLEHYFKHYYSKLNDFDQSNVTEELEMPTPQFDTVASKFSMISEDSLTIYVPYGKGKDLISDLKTKGVNSWCLRELQRYSVSIGKWDASEIEKLGVSKIDDSTYVLDDTSNYSDDTGFIKFNPYIDKELII